MLSFSMGSNEYDTYYFGDPPASDNELSILRDEFLRVYPEPEDYVRECMYQQVVNLRIAGYDLRQFARRFGMTFGDPIESVEARDALAARIYQIGVPIIRNTRSRIAEILKGEEGCTDKEWDDMNDERLR